MENAITIRPMIYKEAREVVDQINSNMNNVRYLVLDLYERKGWEALGYASWRDCVTKEFQQSQRHLYEQLEAAQTEKNICATAQNIPERQLRPLAKLRDNPDQQREAWQKAVETAPEGKVTAAHVSKVVKEMTGTKAIRIGQLLTEQKEFIGHGLFLSWMKSNIDISERTARNYMGLYAHRDKTANIADLQEAYHQIETLEAQAKQSKKERDRKLIAEYRRTGKKYKHQNKLPESGNLQDAYRQIETLEAQAKKTA